MGDHNQQNGSNSKGKNDVGEDSGGKTYYLTIPVRPLTGEVAEEHLERLTLYYTTYGLVFGAVGAIAIVLPIVFSISILPLLAWLLVAGGAITVMQFLLVCGAPGTTSFLLLGVLHMAAGLFMLIQPEEAAKRIIWLLAGWFLIHGILKILMSCQVRKVTTWPAVFASGFLSLALALVVIMLGSRFGLALVAIFFGSDLVFTGLSLMLVAFMAYLGKGNRAVSDLDASNEPLLQGRGPPAAAV